MRILVVDNEELAVRTLCNTINKVIPDADITSVTDSREALDAAFKIRPEIAFLDIDMPVLNGIKVAQAINAQKNDSNLPFVVFVTSKDNLVFDALKQFPYSFIRKSHIDQDLEDCIIKIYSTLNKDQNLYPIKEGRNIVYVDINSILYCEKQKNYIVYHTTNTTYSERGNMEDKVSDLIKKGFLQTHIGFLVNARHIVELKTNSVSLDNGVEVPISKRFRGVVKEKYMSWLVEEYA